MTDMQTKLFHTLVITAGILATSCRTAPKANEASNKIEAQLADYLPQIDPFPRLASFYQRNSRLNLFITFFKILLEPS